jgi:hypothetical protein
LSILQDIHLLSMTCGPLGFLHAAIVFRNLRVLILVLFVAAA